MRGTRRRHRAIIACRPGRPVLQPVPEGGDPLHMAAKFYRVRMGSEDTSPSTANTAARRVRPSTPCAAYTGTVWGWRGPRRFGAPAVTPSARAYRGSSAGSRPPGAGKIHDQVTQRSAQYVLIRHRPGHPRHQQRRRTGPARAGRPPQGTRFHQVGEDHGLADQPLHARSNLEGAGYRLCRADDEIHLSGTTATDPKTI